MNSYHPPLHRTMNNQNNLFKPFGKEFFRGHAKGFNELHQAAKADVFACLVTGILRTGDAVFVGKKVGIGVAERLAQGLDSCGQLLNIGIRFLVPACFGSGCRVFLFLFHDKAKEKEVLWMANL